MDNLQDIFSSVLSDPEAVSKLRSLGKELGLTSDSSDNPSPSQPISNQESSQFPDLSALSSLMQSKDMPSPKSSPAGNLSAETLSAITKFMPLLSGLSQEDETTALLYALRPFLSSQKRQRLDEAGKMLKVMKLLPKLKSTGLF